MPDTLTSPIAAQSSFRDSLLAGGLFGLAFLLVYHQTVWSMVSIWLRTGTYAHGFLILPIALWMMWSGRDRLRVINPRPALWVPILMLPLGFVWLLAWQVDVLVVQQFALVAMLVVGVWAILGHQLARTLSFPLFFLFFAVPMGEALVPPMMEFTATATVWLIEQTGVPVYREGLYFTLPTGNWSVVEACSGIRYIIASLTLGVLYAYLTYRSFWRRALFVLVSALVPVLANAGRAFLIVMLGHFSDMRIAVGIDHLIYGWVFFGVVMFLLFWLGSFFREDDDAAPGDSSNCSRTREGAASAPSKLFVTSFVALLAAAVWPLLASTTEPRLVDARPLAAVVPPLASGEWRTTLDPEWKWRPEASVAGQVAAYYELEGVTLGLFIQYPDGKTEGGEVVGSAGRFVKRRANLRVVSRDTVAVQLGEASVQVNQVQLRGVPVDLLAWSWYSVGDLQTSNEYLAKLQEARANLGSGRPGSYRIVVALPLREQPESARIVLQKFLDEHAGPLDTALNQAMEGGH